MAEAYDLLNADALRAYEGGTVARTALGDHLLVLRIEPEVFSLELWALGADVITMRRVEANRLERHATDRSRLALAWGLFAMRHGVILHEND